MGNSTKQGFGNTTVLIEPHIPYPDISDNIQQTLGRGLLWDSQNNIWREAVCDIDGRLLVSNSGVPLNLALYGSIGITAAATLLRAANPNRREIVFQNKGGINVWIGFTNAVTAVNGILLAPGSFYDNDRYTGEYWVISTAVVADAIAYQEF